MWLYYALKKKKPTNQKTLGSKLIAAYKTIFQEVNLGTHHSKNFAVIPETEVYVTDPKMCPHSFFLLDVGRLGHPIVTFPVPHQESNDIFPVHSAIWTPKFQGWKGLVYCSGPELQT